MFFWEPFNFRQWIGTNETFSTFVAKTNFLGKQICKSFTLGNSFLH